MDSSKALKVLVVDDEIEYTMALEIILQSEGYSVVTANSGEEALKLMESDNFDVVLSDLIMGGMDGLKLLESVKDEYPDTEVIIITGHGTVQNAVEAMKKGAFTYFVKSHDPDDLKKEVAKLDTLRKAKNRGIIAEASDQMKPFMLESKSHKYRKSLKMARMAADSKSNILIIGESGVGKEVFARYIHACSSRTNEAFVAVNCSALSETLLESELFGHEKGAYTGANTARIGRFEAANQGTLLLDELGEVSLSTQVKLLRTLENKQIERLGGNESIDVDFRLLSATNRDLKQAIADGDFREDLYFRVSTIIIEIPPLRDRREDLPDLISFFFEKSTQEMNREIRRIDEDVMQALLSYDYPGNVRELKNMIERLVVLSEEGIVKKTYLFNEAVSPDEIDTVSYIRPLKDVRKEMEAEYIRSALKICDNNVTETAKRLGISKRQLFNKINEYDLRQ